MSKVNYRDQIRRDIIKNQYCIEEDTKIDEYGISVLNKIKYDLLKKKFKKDLKNT